MAEGQSGTRSRSKHQFWLVRGGAFASELRVNRILSEAGFTGIRMEPCNLALDIAIGHGLDAAVQSALEIGPANRALEGQPPEIREEITGDPEVVAQACGNRHFARFICSATIAPQGSAAIWKNYNGT